MNDANPDRCPHCWKRLTSRHVETLQAAVFECGACGGFWIPWEILQELGERTRSNRPLLWHTTAAPDGNGQRNDRRCPGCESVMDRQSCGGIVLDICRAHGVWFDHSELEAFVSWVQEEKRSAPAARVAYVAGAAALAATPALSSQQENASQGFEVGAVFEVGEVVFEALAALVELLADAANGLS